MNSHQKSLAFWGRYIFTSISLLSIFRVVFLIYHFPDSPISMEALIMSLLNGIRFDLSTIGYTLLPLWAIHSIFSLPFFKKLNLGLFISLFKIYSIIILILWTTIFVLDIGFFKEYYTRLNYIAIEYLAFFSYVLDTIVKQFPYNFLLLIVPLLIFIEIKFFWPRINPVPIYTFNKFYNWAVAFLISTMLMILLIRGGIQSRPLNWSHTNITSFRFTNQLSVNPLWNMGMTWKTALAEETNHKFSENGLSLDETILTARTSIQAPHAEFLADDYPVLRRTTSSINRLDLNVVVILMEAFAGQYVGKLGDNNNITPEFDKLTEEGILFTRMFSSGTRTNRGLAGTLLSFPSLPRFKSILNDASVDQDFSSLAQVLKQRRYKTNFMVGGDLEYDNRHGFFLGQGYDQFYGRNDYGDNIFSTVWGVADEHLFNSAFKILKEMKSPTFTTILTLTNHPTYEFPENDTFQPVMPTMKDQERMNAFKYSDWALGKFMSKCKGEAFYDNTIFVILGDHGFISSDYNQNTSIEIASYHIPCLIIAPNMEPNTITRTASQTDIIPTILDMLGGSFIHNSWGKNLLGKKMATDFAIVVPSGLNHLMGMVTDDTFYIHNFNDEHQLFSISGLSGKIKLNKLNYDVELQLELEQILMGFTKSAHYALNTYKCGLTLD